LVEIKT